MAASSLGLVRVTSPGTPVRLTVNQAAPSSNLACNSIMIQTLSSNVGKVYIGGSAMIKSSLNGVYAMLPIPTANSLPAFSIGNPTAQAAFNAADIFIDADNANDGVLASIVR